LSAAPSALTLIAQISDSHVGAGPGDEDSADALRAAVARVASLDPQPVAVLYTGDLTKDGAPEEFELVREITAPLGMPIHPVPGNHDRREPMRTACSDHEGIAAAGEYLDYAVDCGPVRAIMVDTAVAGKPEGWIGPERIDWIAAELERAGDRPAILAMHHAPVGVGLHEFDFIGLAAEDRAALAELFERGPRPELIACGHIHRAATAQIGRVPIFICPSTHTQVQLDFGPLEKLRMGSEPPGIGVHLHGADPHLVSHMQPV
jgi:3',5'-cyclic AMP phosphodiesterase CpdA